MKARAFIGVSKGFTLIELLITLAILAVLGVMIAPVIQIEVQRQKEAELRIALKDIRKAIDAYKSASDAGRIEKAESATGYPKSLDLLVRGVVDKKDPKSKKIFFLRRIPLDPLMSSSMTKEAKEIESYGWGLRSYDSEPDAPSPGNDVFDIYSNSKGVGLNNVPYNKW
jgi:prepilin-type N-terminal cleavage/methylation domain-containing protein